MSTERRVRALVAVGLAAASLIALVLVRPAPAREPAAPSQSGTRTASVALLTTHDVRVAVVARRLSGGSAPTADVRVAVARRVGGSWRETSETRLREPYFWHTVTGPRAVCRLEIVAADGRASQRPHVAVQVLQSPSLGCGRVYRTWLVG
jgi:hypothetical protein